MEDLLLWLVILGGAMGSGPVLQARGQQLRLPVTTIAIAVVTLGFSVWGTVEPDVLDALSRDRDLLLDGQWWRLATPLVVQDGGWVGTTFNIVALLALGSVTEFVFGWRTLLTVYLAAGLVSEVVAYTVIQHQGFAGNSVAVMGLAGLLIVTFVQTGPMGARVPGAIGLLAEIALVATGNLHGAGFAIGAIAGVMIVRRDDP